MCGMKNIQDGINGRLDMAEEKISEFEDRRENSGETEMIETMELAGKVIKKWLQ